MRNNDSERKDPRVLRTRRLIFDAMLELLQAKNFDEITVQDIARTATINRVTFYAHFQDKYALLDALMRQRFRARLDENGRDDAAESDVAPLLETTALNVFRFVAKRQRRAIDKEFEPQLERAMQDELYYYLRGTIDDSAALVVSSAIIGAAMQWQANKSAERPEEIAHRIAEVLATGVSNPRLRSAS